MQRRSIEPEPVVEEMRIPFASIVGRVGLTLAGVTALFVGAFLVWLRPDGLTGADLSHRVFYRQGPDALVGGSLASAGMVAIGLGLASIVGLADRSGWTTRLAGALGLAAAAIYTINVYRAPDLPVRFSIGPGVVALFGGSLLVLLGGFVGAIRRIIVPADVGDLERLVRMQERRTLLHAQPECHLIPQGNGWDVVGPEPDRDPEHYATVEQAQARAKTLLRENGGGDVIVHRRSGRVRTREHVTAA